jgi:nitroreductase
LIFADSGVYRAPGELDFMPYLDAGVVIGHLYLAATAAGLSCCYTNPNIRDINRLHFAETFGAGVFCGAFAAGWPSTAGGTDREKELPCATDDA